MRAKTGGRKAQTPNKINAETRLLIQNLVSSEVQKIPEMLEGLKPRDRIELIIKMLSFVIPKQSKIELEADIKDRFNPVIVHMQETKLLEQ